VVPARLSVRNFLCYRDCPPIDLERIRVACLTGDNGNGKSALLDAITWALWGRARAKSDGDLVTLGQSEMEVEFEFFVGEARYRVIRKYRRSGSKGSGQTGLEFHAWDGAGWRVLSGSSLRETQYKIEDVLKLGYETFVNSAFLVQGRADAFTIKSPGERKEVLAEILNLAQYDAYLERAKERRNARARTVELLTTMVHDAEVELAGLPRRRAEREEAAAELAERDGERQEAVAVVSALRQSLAEIANLTRELSAADSKRAEAADLLARAEGQVAARRAEIERYRGVVARGDTIRSEHERLVVAREALSRCVAENDSLRRQIEEAERVRDDAASELAQAEDRASRQQDAIRRFTAVVEQGESIRKGFARLRAARATIAEQDQRFQAQVELETRITALTAAAARAESELRTELRLRTDEASRLEALAATVEPLLRERDAAGREQAELDAMEKRRDSLRTEETELRGAAQSLTSRNTVLRDEMDGLKRKFDELKDAVEAGAADCPLCRSNLGHEGLRRVEESYQSEGREKASEYRENQKRIHEHEAGGQARAEEARRLEADLRRRQGDWRSRVDRLDRDLEAARQAGEQAVGARAHVQRVNTALDTGDYAGTEREQIAELRREAGALGYDRAAHERARRDLAECGDFEQRHHDLIRAESELAAARALLSNEESAADGWRRRRDEALIRIAETHQRLAELPLDRAQRQVDELTGCEADYQELLTAETRLPVALDALGSEEQSLEGWRRRRDDEETHAIELRLRLAGLSGVEERVDPAEERARQLEQRCGELRLALGASEQEIERLEEKERQTRTQRSQLAEAKREHGIYEELVRIFGRQGVQAAIIDSVLPEIESAANELLARMTNNRMHLTLDTQRLNQKGTTQETLDIKIADEWGTRSYEMFSGGESFRINLALRIALSKLLARRAGAPLPTLVIDEGFGTQDAAGRERLVEAINAIQDEFQCLLIVTHLDELKDLFETRIEVVKSGEGSVARVVTV
jgi:exonuclease SbcC